MTFMLILLVIIFFILVLVKAINPYRSDLSLFELNRRKQLNSENNLRLLREELAPYIISIREILTSLLVVVFTIISVYTLGWLFGIIISLVVLLEYSYISKLGAVQGLVDKIYSRIEKRVLAFFKKIKPYLKYIGYISTADITTEKTIGSKDELVEIVSSSTILTADEKKLITAGLSFDTKSVSEVMTPRSEIKYIAKTEYLGPLMLDELHKIGHSRLPVIDGDIDHIVGILHLRDLLSLDIKKSSTVTKAMEDKVYYIREDQTLGDALGAFIKTNHHLFIVIDKTRQTRGLISLEDVIEALIGKEIHDEYEAHTNINVVAKRDVRPLNSPKHRVDV